MQCPSHTAVLVKIFRTNPPDQPGRFYKRNAEGKWLRRSADLKFLGVKGDRLVGRVCLFGTGSR